MVPIDTMTFVPGDDRIGQYMRLGGTMYRCNGGHIRIVPSGASHSDAWRATRKACK